MPDTTWVDCGCCGRTHADIPGEDCRSFVTCEVCGDAYHKSEIDKHEGKCKGVTLSELPDAVFSTDETEA